MSSFDISTPVSYRLVSRTALTLSPLLVRVPPMRLTTVSKLTSGLPFQFRLMKENSRCSILFHLLVPGG